MMVCVLGKDERCDLLVLRGGVSSCTNANSTINIKWQSIIARSK